MMIVCAWCGVEISGSLGAVAHDHISHGICDECLQFVEANQPGPLHAFLNKLNGPVLCVDADGRVVTANIEARGMLGKDLSRVEGLLGGDVMECRWARLPGGCGQTEHCVACTVRQTVTATIQTGQNALRQPAYLDRETAGGEVERIYLLLSTELENSLVLLRIDYIGSQAPANTESPSTDVE